MSILGNFARASSGIKNYVSQTVTWTANEMRYTNNFVMHNILTTTITYNVVGSNTNVDLLVGINHFTFTLNNSFELVGTTINEGQNVSIFIGIGPNVPIPAENDIPLPIVTITFIEGDIYLINLSTNLNIPYTSASLIVFRPLAQSFNRQNEGVATSDILTNDVINNLTNDIVLDPCELVKVPILNIVGYTLSDGSDIGEVTFTILDQYQYDKKEPLQLTCKKCKPHYIKRKKIKETQFIKCCVKIVSVFKGKGCTLFDKLQYIWIKKQPTINFDVFYERVFLYAMSKYILCRLLYGHFDIHYLLQKFNKQFLKDLKHSRFCGALTLFVDPQSIVFGYNQYFKK